MHPKKQPEAGLTLLELLLVVTLIGIISAIAVPQLGRARAASLEASTVASLRTIHSAQAAYATTCASGFYAPSMTWLARSVAGVPPFIGRELSANTTDRYGYRIRFTQGTRVRTSPRTCNGLGQGQAVGGYFVGADPLTTTGGSGSRYFAVVPSGALYQSSRRVRPILTGEPPPPARPIG
jgi:prepilin-type N-terminal cleavage/methylation domain-containing protein